MEKTSVMQRLMALAPLAFNLPKTGDIIEGTVIKKSAGNLIVDLGIWGTGTVYGREFNAALSIIKTLKPGDKVLAKITDIENEEGLKELSLTEAESQKSWDIIAGLKKENKVIPVKILGANRGGLVVEVSGVAGFLPVSQLKAEHYPRVEGGDKNKIFDELSKFVGQTFEVRVISFDPREGKLIVSEKAAVEEGLKQVIGQYQVGNIIAGTVSGLVDWGAFIKWPVSSGGNLEGLIHVSELDWQLVENPADFVKVGQAVSAQIIDITENRISLSLKRLKTDPWKNAALVLKKDDVVSGGVKKFNPYGAFVDAAYGEAGETLQGLCHISEFGSDEIMKKTLAIGEKRLFKILAFTPEEHRLSLGLIKDKEAEAA